MNYENTPYYGLLKDAKILSTPINPNYNNNEIINSIQGKRFFLNTETNQALFFIDNEMEMENFMMTTNNPAHHQIHLNPPDGVSPTADLSICDLDEELDREQHIDDRSSQVSAQLRESSRIYFADKQTARDNNNNFKVKIYFTNTTNSAESKKRHCGYRYITKILSHNMNFINFNRHIDDRSLNLFEDSTSTIFDIKYKINMNYFDRELSGNYNFFVDGENIGNRLKGHQPADITIQTELFRISNRLPEINDYLLGPYQPQMFNILKNGNVFQVIRFLFAIFNKQKDLQISLFQNNICTFHIYSLRTFINNMCVFLDAVRTKRTNGTPFECNLLNILGWKNNPDNFDNLRRFYWKLDSKLRIHDFPIIPIICKLNININTVQQNIYLIAVNNSFPPRPYDPRTPYAPGPFRAYNSLEEQTHQPVNPGQARICPPNSTEGDDYFLLLLLLKYGCCFASRDNFEWFNGAILNFNNYKFTIKHETINRLNILRDINDLRNTLKIQLKIHSNLKNYNKSYIFNNTNITEYFNNVPPPEHPNNVPPPEHPNNVPPPEHPNFNNFNIRMIKQNLFPFTFSNEQELVDFSQYLETSPNYRSFIKIRENDKNYSFIELVQLYYELLRQIPASDVRYNIPIRNKIYTSFNLQVQPVITERDFNQLFDLTERNTDLSQEYNNFKNFILSNPNNDPNIANIKNIINFRRSQINIVQEIREFMNSASNRISDIEVIYGGLNESCKRIISYLNALLNTYNGNNIIKDIETLVNNYNTIVDTFIASDYLNNEEHLNRIIELLFIQYKQNTPQAQRTPPPQNRMSGRNSAAQAVQAAQSAQAYPEAQAVQAAQSAQAVQAAQSAQAYPAEQAVQAAQSASTQQRTSNQSTATPPQSRKRRKSLFEPEGAAAVYGTPEHAAYAEQEAQKAYATYLYEDQQAQLYNSSDIDSAAALKSYKEVKRYANKAYKAAYGTPSPTNGNYRASGGTQKKYKLNNKKLKKITNKNNSKKSNVKNKKKSFTKKKHSPKKKSLKTQKK